MEMSVLVLSAIFSATLRSRAGGHLVPRRLEEGQEARTANVGVKSTVLVRALQGRLFEDYAAPAKRTDLPQTLHTGLTS